ncbi:MAG: glutamate--tRNA ligase, partial [Rhizorhabdus sp.]|nr:glutamate--tRNA ligase [Rhizorhabdus sp.]
WEAIRPNLTRLYDAADWWSVVEGSVESALDDEDPAFVRQAAELAETATWDAGTWKALTGQLNAATGRKGKALFLPLRLALTGREHGPDMNALLPLIGRDRAIARLRAAGS